MSAASTAVLATALPAAVLAMLVLPVAAGAATVSGGQAEARDAARSGNCTPTKLEVVRYAPGLNATTVFKVSCSEDKDAFVLVQCRGRTCTLLR